MLLTKALSWFQDFRIYNPLILQVRVGSKDHFLANIDCIAHGTSQIAELTMQSRDYTESIQYRNWLQGPSYSFLLLMPQDVPVDLY